MRTNIQEKWLKVDDIRIHCLTAGERGSSVLLLHGGGSDSSSLSYGLSIASISQSHRVFAPDWPGYGKSDKPDIKYSQEFYINLLEHIMNVLDLEKANLVGISMGGGISLGFSLRLPERVEKLVLVDSHGLGKEVPWRVLTYIMVKLSFLNKIARNIAIKSRKVVKQSLRTLLYNPESITENLVDEVWQAVKTSEGGRAFRSWQKGEVRWKGLKTNYVDKLHTLTDTDLILHGAEDKYIPASWAQRAHERIKGSELHIIPECGHWLTREKADEFNRLILNFLSER